MKIHRLVIQDLFQHLWEQIFIYHKALTKIYNNLKSKNKITMIK